MKERLKGTYAGIAAGKITAPPLFNGTDNLLSVKDLTRKNIDKILEGAEKFQRYCDSLDIARIERARPERLRNLKDITGVHMFSESSTRTKTSFQLAMENLGGSIINFELATSSRSKRESLKHTIEQVLDYPSSIRVLIVRDKREEVVRKIGEYAAAQGVPVINGGDGPKEHPTQTLVDLYTIKRFFNRMEDLEVAIVGDPLHSRTAHSLILGLTYFPDIKVTIVAPPMLQIGKEELCALGVKHTITDDLKEALRADVLYMNRFQEERFENEAEREQARAEFRKFCLTEKLVKRRKNLIIMHPRPITEGPDSEIPEAIDELPQAIYREQAKAGVPVRMALLDYMLKPRESDSPHK